MNKEQNKVSSDYVFRVYTDRGWRYIEKEKYSHVHQTGIYYKNLLVFSSKEEAYKSRDIVNNLTKTFAAPRFTIYPICQLVKVLKEPCFNDMCEEDHPALQGEPIPIVFPGTYYVITYTSSNGTKYYEAPPDLNYFATTNLLTAALFSTKLDAMTYFSKNTHETKLLNFKTISFEKRKITNKKLNPRYK